MNSSTVPSRRAFMRQSGLLLAGVFCRSRRIQAETQVRFAVRGPFPDKDLRRRAELLKKLGYSGIELGPEYMDQSSASIMNDLKDSGILVTAIVGSLQLLSPDPAIRSRAVGEDRKRLRKAAEIGASAVIEVPVFGERRFTEIGSDDNPYSHEDGLLVEGLQRLAETVEETGVSILLEPLTRRETYYMNRQEHGARIIDAVGIPGFRLLSDFYHMQMEEANVAETLQQLGRYTGYVHLADGPDRTEPGSLAYDYRPGFKALKAAGFSGWLTIESKASDNPEHALLRARSYVEKQWATA